MSALGTIVPLSQAALDRTLREIGGCGDGDCIVIRPQGQHTNGGCRCNTNAWKMMKVVHAHRCSAGEIRAAYHLDLARENS